MISAISNTLAGLTAASAQVNSAARQVASGNVEIASTDLMQGGAAYKANIAVLKMTAQMENEVTRLFDKTV